MHTALVSRILKDHSAWEVVTLEGPASAACSAHAKPAFADAD